MEAIAFSVVVALVGLFEVAAVLFGVDSRSRVGDDHIR